MLDHAALPIVSFLLLVVIQLMPNWIILFDWWLFLSQFDVPEEVEQESDVEVAHPAAQGPTAPASCPACEAAKCACERMAKPAVTLTSQSDRNYQILLC